MHVVQPILPSWILELVPQTVRDAYALDELFIGDSGDGARWMAGAYLQWRFGDFLSPGWREGVLGETSIGYYGQVV